jgi:excisionase family DNA binding protein
MDHHEHAEVLMKPILCSIAEAAKALGIGRSKTFELISQGVLQTVTIGRRRLVKVSSVEEIAANPTSAGPAG